MVRKVRVPAGSKDQVLAKKPRRLVQRESLADAGDVEAVVQQLALDIDEYAAAYGHDLTFATRTSRPLRAALVERLTVLLGGSVVVPTEKL